jgi:hypothetical protein
MAPLRNQYNTIVVNEMTRSGPSSRVYLSQIAIIDFVRNAPQMQFLFRGRKEIYMGIGEAYPEAWPINC